MALSNEDSTTDPYGNHYFALFIGGLEVAHFVECSGLKSTTTVFEIEEGGLNTRVHKRPGQSKWENITLRTATVASMYLLEWRDAILMDNYSAASNRRDGSIALIGNDGQTVRRWSFKQAWPVSWEGPSLNSGGSELSIETLELAHDGLTVSSS